MRWIRNSLQIIGTLGIIGSIIYYLIYKEELALLIIPIGLFMIIMSFFIKADIITDKEKSRGIIWKDRKRNRLGLPYTFTIYLLDSEILHLRRGLFTTTDDEVKLYRILDLKLKRNLFQKILKLGTIYIDSSDSSMKEFKLSNIKSSQSVKSMLSKLVDENRMKYKVFSMEQVQGSDNLEDIDNNGIPDVFEIGD